jgi:glutathione synthase/RimK-type ligase-like ATP-grasp enzyme
MNDRARLQTALAALERRISAGEATADILAERAGLLAALGRTDDAKQQYLLILQQDPTHFVTLNNFGVLLHETRFRAAARTLFNEAISRHPTQALGHVNLANLLMYDDDLVAAKTHLEIALALDPPNTAAHQRLSGVLHEMGDHDGMRRHRQLGFADRPIESHPYLGNGAPIRLLVLTSTPAADIAWPQLVDANRCAVTTLVVEFAGPDAPLPLHDLIFNAIGDADISHDDLAAALRLIARSSAPIINHPDRVMATGRGANAARLGALPGVRSPKAVDLSRACLADRSALARLAAAGLTFPLLLRSPGFHMGRHFTRVEQQADLALAAEALPGPNLLALEYLDAQGEDGRSRKFRVMMIDGQLFPLHMAASGDWKVHYATSDMATDPALRAEEERFLTEMPTVIGERAMAALEAIKGALGLDYAGVDFAIGADGELLLFEANAVMKIVPADPAPQWDYRRKAIEAALDAARQMLVRDALTGRNLEAKPHRRGQGGY